jgi:hypothetical protein
MVNQDGNTMIAVDVNGNYVYMVVAFVTFDDYKVINNFIIQNEKILIDGKKYLNKLSKMKLLYVDIDEKCIKN